MKDHSILIVGNFLSQKGGTRNVCEDLVERLKTRNWKVISTSNKLSRFIRLIDMMITTWKERHYYNIATIDTYSGLSFIWAELVAFLLRKLNKPYILILHGGNLPVFARAHHGRVTRLLDSASKVTAPSGYLQEEMQLYRQDICIIPNPIDLGNYRYHQRKNNDPVLIWLRAFHRIYNPELAIGMLADLKNKHPKIELRMAGMDTGDGSLQLTKKLANSLGVSASVRFMGRIPNDQVHTFLHQGDIFINTTNYDNTPVSVMEAMATGLCIISTNVGGISNLLEDEQDALLVPPDDPQAMSLAVERILVEPELRIKLSEKARQKVEKFDWTFILPKWEQLFEEVLDDFYNQ